MVPQSLDGSLGGTPQDAGWFVTSPPQAGPQPGPSLRVNPVIGADRFSVEGVGQDKPGFVYVLVTRPAAQDRTVGDVGASSVQCWLLLCTLHTRNWG